MTIDCLDPESLAAFWSALLDRPASREDAAPGWMRIGTRRDAQPRLTFQQVPEPKVGKVRLHLDIEVPDIEAALSQVEQLGGRWTGDRYDYPGEGVVMVMTDPEGNEFCLVEYVDA